MKLDLRHETLQSESQLNDYFAPLWNEMKPMPDTITITSQQHDLIRSWVAPHENYTPQPLQFYHGDFKRVKVEVAE